MLKDIQVRRVRPEESGRYQELMQAHHYLGALPKIGETLWYVATWGQEWVALLSFSAAALDRLRVLRRGSANPPPSGGRKVREKDQWRSDVRTRMVRFRMVLGAEQREAKGVWVERLAVRAECRPNGRRLPA